MNASQSDMVTFKGSPQFSPDETLSVEANQNLHRLVGEVARRKSTWAATTCQQRIDLINDLLNSLKSVASDWVAASCRAKGHAAGTPPAGEEWLAGPCLVARNLRLLRCSLSQIAHRGKPKLPGKPYSRPDGQVVAPVFPTSLFDKSLFAGYAAEVWMEPDVSLDELSDTMATAYGDSRDPAGSVCLVLCAGNVSSIGPMDALYKLFVENQVVVLKMNPVNDYLTDHFIVAFEPLIRAGYVQIINGGSATGKSLCEHSCVDEIHITGSDKTHDAIVYGVGSEGADRKQRRDPICQKRVTSELGNVSPVIIVPGQWSKSEIAFQAENVASMLTNNAGFNCNAVRVLVTHDQWPQRAEFLAALTEVFSRIPTRRAYYPGADDRHAAFIADRDSVAQIGAKDHGTLPWTVVRDLNAVDTREMCFDTEAFCSVMGETGLPGTSVVSYLERAVEFANHRVWGSLNASLIVSPKTLRHREVASAMDRAVANLQFGTVAVNHWAGLNFALCSTTWGAYPEHPQHDIQSGVGVVHNTYMFDRPQKTVLRGPFRPFPKPIWFATHRQTHKVGPALYEFECSPSWFKLPAVLRHAFG